MEGYKMAKNISENQEEHTVVLSIGHAHMLAQAATIMRDYSELQSIAESVLTNANIFGNAAEYHNLSSEYARADDYYNAFMVVQKGLRQYPYDVDLLADAIRFGSYCSKFDECEKYKETLKSRPRGAWNWRAFTFLVDYLIEKVGMSEKDLIMPTLDEALSTALEYKRVLQLEEKAYIAESEVRLLRERYIRESDNPESAIEEHRLAKVALETAIKNESIVSVQCSLKYADMLFEERQYKEVIQICTDALKCVETQPSARIAYFKYLSALSKDALLRKDGAFADKKRVEDVLNEYSVVYQVIDERTYEGNAKTRAALLAAETAVELPEVFQESASSLSDVISKLSAIRES